MPKTDWTRLLAMALVLPLAAACAEPGEEEFETETLETTTTTEMNRVELETFGTADLEGWVTARTEGQELILTLNLGDEGRTGMRETPEAGTEGELGTEREAGAARAEAEDTRHSARLVEGMCSDVRPGAGRTAPGQTPSEETGQPEPEAGQGQQPVRTVAQFRTPDEWSGTTGTARPGTQREGTEPGTTARTTPMGGHTLEAHVQLSEITGRNYAVVVEDDEAVTGDEPIPGAEENVVACAEVTELVRNTRTGGQPGQPGGERGSEESGSSY